MSLFTLRTRGEQQYGPVEMETLRLWVREGSVACDDRIYDHTHDQWLEAGDVPQIRDLFHLEGNGIAPPPEAAPAVPKNGQHPSEPSAPLAPALPHPEKHPHKNHKDRKTTKMLLSHPAGKGHAHNGNHSSKKSPSVLDRISRILLLPFSKKKPHSHHHHGKEEGTRKKEERKEI